MTILDYNDVYSLWLSCAGMGLNSLDDTENGIAKFLERNPETCFVSLIAGRIVGAIMVGTDGRRGYIYHTAVHPDYRKQGIAKALVETALSAVERLGINKVALVVFGKNISGNEFWEKMGFTKREDIIYRNKTIVEFERIDT
ncbi:MAG: GNAT family N-acetyltransferase [Bacteroides sp.]|nr:GNAT family N-acetyltransferase [Prevotella sp.]MCM1469468.1 GNAT family N-acetyltransferase [Bacteroides sp.]